MTHETRASALSRDGRMYLQCLGWAGDNDCPHAMQRKIQDWSQVLERRLHGREVSQRVTVEDLNRIRASLGLARKFAAGSKCKSKSGLTHCCNGKVEGWMGLEALRHVLAYLEHVAGVIDGDRRPGRKAGHEYLMEGARRASRLSKVDPELVMGSYERFVSIDAEALAVDRAYRFFKDAQKQEHGVEGRLAQGIKRSVEAIHAAWFPLPSIEREKPHDA